MGHIPAGVSLHSILPWHFSVPPTTHASAVVSFLKLQTYNQIVTTPDVSYINKHNTAIHTEVLTAPALTIVSTLCFN